jgi:hypothetical protein
VFRGELLDRVGHLSLEGIDMIRYAEGKISVGSSSDLVSWVSCD